MVLQVLWSCRKPPSSPQQPPGFRVSQVPWALQVGQDGNQSLVQLLEKQDFWMHAPPFFPLASVGCTTGPQKQQQATQLSLVFRGPQISRVCWVLSVLWDRQDRSHSLRKLPEKLECRTHILPLPPQVEVRNWGFSSACFVLSHR